MYTIIIIITDALCLGIVAHFLLIKQVGFAGTLQFVGLLIEY